MLLFFIRSYFLVYPHVLPLLYFEAYALHFKPIRDFLWTNIKWPEHTLLHFSLSLLSPPPWSFFARRTSKAYCKLTHWCKHPSKIFRISPLHTLGEHDYKAFGVQSISDSCEWTKRLRYILKKILLVDGDRVMKSRAHVNVIRYKYVLHSRAE